MIILDIVFSKKGRLESMNNAYQVLEERIFEQHWLYPLNCSTGYP